MRRPLRALTFTIAALLGLVGCMLSEKRVGEGEVCTNSELVAGQVICAGNLTCVHATLNDGFCMRRCSGPDGCSAGEICFDGICAAGCERASAACPERPLPDCPVGCSHPDPTRVCCQSRTGAE